MHQFIVFLLLAFIFYSCNSYSQLPSYLKLCSRSDSNLNECLLKNGQEAIGRIVKGDPIYRIPSFIPFKINKVSLEASENIKLYANNVEVTGFDTMELKDITWNLESKVIDTKLFSPTIEITGTYNMDGRILIMTLKGSGPMNNSHYDNHITVKTTYSLNIKNGKEYINLEKVKVKFDIKKVHLYFGNLLNNPQLSEQMNVFMNENWNTFAEEILPSVEAILVNIVQSIINPIAKKVPFDNILTP